jgi:hypothetical protein
LSLPSYAYFPTLGPHKFVDVFVFGKAVPYSKFFKAAEGIQFLSIAISSWLPICSIIFPSLWSPILAFKSPLNIRQSFLLILAVISC